jgi:hypothetical protein
VLRHRSLLNGGGGAGSGFYPLRRTAGRVDRTQGAVAGDRRGLVRVGVKRTVKGSQISRFYTTRWARRSRNHSISVGGFAALRHILTIEPLAGESRVSKAVIGRFLPFQNGRYWPVAAFRGGQLWVDSCRPRVAAYDPGCVKTPAIVQPFDRRDRGGDDHEAIH